MMACREFGPGERVRCPAATERGQCGCPLTDVGVGCRSRACVGAPAPTDSRHPFTVQKCDWCRALVRIEVWLADERAA